MNDQICWDHTLIKKFSTSNHYKMLNQLRSEVKKYPLNKRKNITSNLTNANKISSTSNQSKVVTSIKDTEIVNVASTNQSNISFNNSKNFSIYNKIEDDFPIEQGESKLSNEAQTNVKTLPSTFKDRLTKIDLK